MTREEYIAREVSHMVDEGMSPAVAEVVASVAWNMVKWQYED